MAMVMDYETFRGAVNEVVALYQDLYDHHLANPNEREILSQMFGTMLDVAMDHFLHDIDSVEGNAVKVLFRRTVLSKEREDDLAREGLRPYQKPVTREELLQETPGMIPLLLARAVFCRAFHGMHISYSLGPIWSRFCNNYASKLPSI